MGKQTFTFDKETAALLVQDAADLVIRQFVIDHKIRLDDAQMEILAQTAAKHIGLDIDYPAIAENVIKHITELKDSTDLFLTEAVRGDLFERIKKEVVLTVEDKEKIAQEAYALLPTIKDGKDGKAGDTGKDGKDGKTYTLTGQDKTEIADVVKSLLPSLKDKNKGITSKIRADIAEAAVTEFMNSEKAVQAIVDAVVASKRIVSREGFSKKLRELKEMINLSRKQKKAGINAGISGQDMIDEITKILGETWQTGGVADLTLPPIIKTLDAILALSEAQNVIEYQNGVNNRVFTVPLNSSVPHPVGSWFETWRTGSGELTIAQENAGTQVFRSVLGDVNFKIDGQDGFSVIGLKTDTDTWLFKGNIKAA